MYLNDANGNRVNCKSIQGTIEKWKDDSIDCDLVSVLSISPEVLGHFNQIMNIPYFLNLLYDTKPCLYVAF